MTPRLIELFREYESGHRHPTNQLTHKVAIPVILFHIIAMLDWIHFGPVFAMATANGDGLRLSGGTLGIVIAGSWYFRNDLRLGAILTAYMLACLVVGWHTPAGVVIALAVVGWLIQFSGHYIWEKQHPSFFTNLLQALVGPAYFTARLFKFYP